MSIYGIVKDDRRIGTVMKIMGEPPKTRWVAYASGERHKGFPTKKKAVQWLLELDASEKNDADQMQGRR